MKGRGRVGGKSVVVVSDDDGRVAPLPLCLCVGVCVCASRYKPLQAVTSRYKPWSVCGWVGVFLPVCVRVWGWGGCSVPCVSVCVCVCMCAM
eukprot:COSAG02_NODE_923_length_15877_cov_26.660920_14_plen_92_part_00